MTDAAWRKGLVAQARIYIGVREEPAGSNLGPQTGRHAHVIEKWQRWANGQTGYPWCAAFVCGMVRERYRLVVPDPRRASVGFLEAWARKVGATVTRPFAGDLVCYRLDADNWPDHIGIVDRVLAPPVPRLGRYGSVRTIEGNTSHGDNANGGQVQVRYRSMRRCTFIRLRPELLEKAPS